MFNPGAAGAMLLSSHATLGHPLLGYPLLG